MRILKYIFLLLLLACIGITVYVATQKGDFKVTRSWIIHTPKSTVFDYVNDYKNWETFGSWMSKDNPIQFTYPAKTMGAGARFSWQNNSDTGDLRTHFVKENDSIAQKANWNGTVADVHFKFSDTLDGTKVTVQIRGKMDVLTKIKTFFSGGIHSIIVDGMEKSLRNLDKTLAYEIKTYSIKVNGISQRNSGYCLKQTVSCKVKNVTKNIKIFLPKMVHFFKKNQLPMAGKPFVLYERYDIANDIVTFSVCMPTQKQIFISSGSDVTSAEIVPFTCIKTTLTGDYSHLQEAWAKARKYIADKGYTENFAGKYSEVYLKTIDDVKQPSQWITEIHIPVFPKAAPAVPLSLPITPTATSTPETAPEAAIP
ncbi:GyrI-like domain-containing protein [Flavobacterium sedimenticola]|uniref:Transcriptional regulator n=1 Tax=Flavobacterium sedimenticola TaxID=3043286 RepID=A0ABT6XST9_9FLAO|nr:GyrI-like domain-containing protein [Flavobacterium sedimenticola]MDI9258121.1 transcriptional regulator [Flavobacterium sedimenticola]